MTDLSILIPARNEMFLTKTVEDILKNMRGDTEIVAVLDGAWADPPLPQHARLHVVYLPEPVGQRAATNLAARISRGKYLMKVDAHCAFDEGFDVKLMQDMQPDWTLVPVMRNLHAFNWVCVNGHTRYQGPSGPCHECGQPTSKDVVWIAKTNPQSMAYCFDPEPHFQYFRDFNKRREGKGDLTESMSLQGSCFMCTRDKYFELNLCDEAFGSWGSQGIEVACKTWLSGGRVVVSHKTWYAHMFRTQGGDFGFPYPLDQRKVDYAKQYAREQFFNHQWPKQTRPLSWLVKKFWPVPGWTDVHLAQLLGGAAPVIAPKGVVFYTDSMLDERIAVPVRRHLQKSLNGHEVVSVSLKPLDLGRNIALTQERGILTMFKQILAGLEASTAEIIFFCEHDVLYHPSHFDFMPPRRDVFYYNTNVWKVRYADGHAVRVDFCQQTSGLCAYRELLLEHYTKRVERVAREGYDRHLGFEPGTHSFPRGVDNYKSQSWESEYPNIDIRHDKTLTPSRWSPDKFRNPKYAKGWRESDSVPGWDYAPGHFTEFLDGLR